VNYQEAITYIVDCEGYERGFVANPFAGDEAAALGLRRTAGLLDQLGKPQERLRIAHVAGTKGKGSTCAMIASIARAGGLSTGLYATPHLHTFRERILLDGEPVSEERFASLTARVALAVDQLVAEMPELGPPTAFEIVTTMALLAFAEAGVDLAVVEVGLGGRLDATNVVTPDVAAISSISFDHVAILGNTLAEIASEKGGIIKQGRPVAIGLQSSEALETLLRIAGERGAPVHIAGRDWSLAGNSGSAHLSGPWGDWHDVQIGLLGRHQVENAGLALMASWMLYPEIAGNEATARKGLRSVVWPGRFELVAESPAVYVDGAHNVDSMIRLVDTLDDIASGSKLTVIFGVARDKDLPGMLAPLAKRGIDFIATASNNPRAVDPEDIALSAMKAGIRARVIPDIGNALKAARTSVGEDGVVCVTGSLYVVAEAREALGIATTPEFERSLLYR
jgi:dihydrofolate synthase / folylpolyglutamate synthase